MTRDEFEARKRRLEEELRSGTELLQAAFQTQLRALEMVWMGTSGEPAAPQPPPPAAAPEPPHQARPSVGKVYSDLLAALPDLPEVPSLPTSSETQGGWEIREAERRGR